VVTYRQSLSEALADVEAGAIASASTVVVSRRWWERLSPDERDRYQARAARLGLGLRADGAISSNLVEIRGGDSGPPLSSERPV
jgi:hypothetical protein